MSGFGDYENKEGRWERKSHLSKILIILGIIGIGCFVAVESRGSGTDFRHSYARHAVQSSTLGRQALRNCQKGSDGTFYCGDQKLYEKAKSMKWYVQEETFRARFTAYSRASSCHHPVGKLCLTASGRDTRENRTVACPRRFPLNSIARFGGRTLFCEDRYANWVQEKYGDTIDIFFEDAETARKFGVRYAEVTIEESTL